jgi:hypothetical protein
MKNADTYYTYLLHVTYYTLVMKSADTYLLHTIHYTLVIHLVYLFVEHYLLHF